MAMARVYLLTGILIAALAVLGCASGKDQGIPAAPSQFQDVKTVSVSPFTCPDASVAGIVQSAIVGELLSDYTVVLGQDADVSVSGSISLSPDGNVGEIKADIIKDGEKADCAVITAGSGKTSSPESLGRETGARIREILSRE